MNTVTLLINISSTEPTTWRELLNALDGDCPEKGDKPAWRGLFQAIEALEVASLVEVERRDGKVEQLILTPLGAERAREALRKDGYIHGK